MERFALSVFLSLCVGAGSYYVRFLNFKGSVAAAALALVIFGTGGWRWTTPILTFFVLSSLLSKLGNVKKKKFESMFEKPDIRDHGQVLANGGVGGFLALAQLSMPSMDFYPAYLGSVAAVTADTWGTELGLLANGKTISLVSFRAVPKGVNGGVSMAGFIAGIFGACVVAVSSLPWYWGTREAAVIVVAGAAASLVDSFLGATVQAEYECAVCRARTERKTHCNSPAMLVRGKEWITNDVVNWACALSGASFGWISQSV